MRMKKGSRSPLSNKVLRLRLRLDSEKRASSRGQYVSDAVHATWRTLTERRTVSRLPTVLYWGRYRRMRHELKGTIKGLSRGYCTVFECFELLIALYAVYRLRVQQWLFLRALVQKCNYMHVRTTLRGSECVAHVLSCSNQSERSELEREGSERPLYSHSMINWVTWR
jgi:hypothetical protein